MDDQSAKSVDAVMCVVAFVLVAVIAGHVYIDELLVGVRWFASEVVEPTFDLDEHF